MTVAGVTIAGTEDEDLLPEYFDSDADDGELPDPLVDGAEADGTMKVSQKELDRLAEFGVYGTVCPCCSRKEASYDTLGVGPQTGRNQGAIRRKRVQGRRNEA